ncbi:glycoside hydrolase family 13 protein [Nocardia beijingensis]|uniref:glycoside hydrolase family 13 protein n=1 Tax=Nocardia beijingensis TaxID=95162 RepID=UPI0018944000|nr:alpha-amylase family glycosyl hydrolase [Nocardia beijingensis]MBF6465672.1 glycoside hydrolase family 13 protein [Nocardia beijingensis]
MAADASWWRDAVIYEIYIRSFGDGDGDGLGDIAGIRSRLPYLRDLGVDAIWITPWYPSPMADGGYDVADYCDIDPRFGTLADAQELIDEVHAQRMRIILDLVPNHTSDQHPWFQEALAAGPGSPERARYLFRDGTSSGGPPNNWRSVFGGPAWTRVADGQWYLHLFDAHQPDLDWQQRDVRAEFESILRFWLDRGVDGFRVDVAHGLIKHADLPDIQTDHEDILEPPDRTDHPHWDRPEVHDIYRSWRAITESYGPDRIFVAEAWVAKPERLARYVRPDELHTAFNFDFLRCSWHADALRAVVDCTTRALDAVGAPPTWVLSNHDITRHVTRYGRASTRGGGAQHESHGPVDVALGRRRARAALLLMLALPGSAYLYQGEELGLEELEDLPVEVLQDPTWERSGRTARGRDGCRVPLPWSGFRPPFGFSPGDTPTWLPQPQRWVSLTAELQKREPDSMLALYHRALGVRRKHSALGEGAWSWLPSDPGVLAFHRAPGLACIVNISGGPAPLPRHERVLLSSEPLPDGALPADSAAWLEVADHHVPQRAAATSVTTDGVGRR